MIHLLPVIVTGTAASSSLAAALLRRHQFLSKVRSEILFNNKKNEDKKKYRLSDFQIQQ
ncbi:transmembrane protein, putative [Medicago truncatula]|uniref:Transmembrane protein, putative n=1 Tax=Medicago truncatula TaxID=3880 RepID=A0A072TRP2_MEDTR|nr:transmembrane protein, putative [Medicago truncatula]